MLAELKISSNISRVRFEQLLEVIRSRVVIAGLDAFERQAVSRECVRRFVGHELLEYFAAALLGWRHSR
jgi:hypothetical protein